MALKLNPNLHDLLTYLARLQPPSGERNTDSKSLLYRTIPHAVLEFSSDSGIHELWYAWVGPNRQPLSQTQCINKIYRIIIIIIVIIIINLFIELIFLFI